MINFQYQLFQTFRLIENQTFFAFRAEIYMAHPDFFWANGDSLRNSHAEKFAFLSHDYDPLRSIREQETIYCSVFMLDREPMLKHLDTMEGNRGDISTNPMKKKNLPYVLFKIYFYFAVISKFKMDSIIELFFFYVETIETIFRHQ